LPGDQTKDRFLRENEIAHHEFAFVSPIENENPDAGGTDRVVVDARQLQLQVMIAEHRGDKAAIDEDVVMEAHPSRSLEQRFARVVDNEIAVDLIEVLRSGPLSGKPPTSRFGRSPSGDGRSLLMKTLSRMIVVEGVVGIPAISDRAVWYFTSMQ
jgi:hypothetical protein